MSTRQSIELVSHGADSIDSTRLRVDIEKGTLAGTLEIRDLTPELDSLVTFFEYVQLFRTMSQVGR